ncbi:hypothetical protein BDQ17DRAFT_1414262 [Cyathus striatus]|nr:hypothetical protein BDQ17DRAFT_1414262 [Cyathus striatus]
MTMWHVYHTLISRLNTYPGWLLLVAGFLEGLFTYHSLKLHASPSSLRMCLPRLNCISSSRSHVFAMPEGEALPGLCRTPYLHSFAPLRCAHRSDTAKQPLLVCMPDSTLDDVGSCETQQKTVGQELSGLEGRRGSGMIFPGYCTEIPVHLPAISLTLIQEDRHQPPEWDTICLVHYVLITSTSQVHLPLVFFIYKYHSHCWNLYVTISNSNTRSTPTPLPPSTFVLSSLHPLHPFPSSLYQSELEGAEGEE